MGIGRWTQEIGQPDPTPARSRKGQEILVTEVKVRYFNEPGSRNTGDTITIGIKRAMELELRDVVVATTSGNTALSLKEEADRTGFSGNLVAVTYHVGFSKPNEDRMGSDMRKKLEESGFRIVTGIHALSGPERSFRYKFNGIYPLEMVASTLRLFSQGVKTCVEIAVMAADAGAVLSGEDALFIAGTGKGADTACVISPAHQNNFLDLCVREILAKPR